MGTVLAGVKWQIESTPAHTALSVIEETSVVMEGHDGTHNVELRGEREEMKPQLSPQGTESSRQGGEDHPDTANAEVWTVRSHL